MKNREVFKNSLEEWQRKNLRKNKRCDDYYGNNQGYCEFNDKSKNLIEPGLAWRNRTENLIQGSNDGIEKFAGHPDYPHAKENIKGTEGTDFQHLIQNRRNLYDRIKLFGKTNNEVIDVGIDS